MPIYSYRGKNLKGDEIRGLYDAEEKAVVAAMIRQKGYHPVYIKERKLLFVSQPTVPPKDLAMFFKQLSTMMKAGMTVVDSLFLLELQTRNKRLKKALGQVIDDVRRGNTISKSFENHRNTFPEMTIRLIEIGEDTGFMEDILERLARYFEGIHRQRERIKTAMIYPAMVGAISLLVVTFLVSRVLPTFSKLFIDAQVPLPLFTRALIKLSEKFGMLLTIIPLCLAAIFFGIAKYRSRVEGALKLSKIELNIPILGSINRKSQISLFCTMLSLSLSSGAPLLTALEITKGSLNNEVFRQEMEIMRQGLKNGQTLAEVMDGELFTNTLEQMVRSGEQTGNLEEMLKNASTLFNDEIEELLERVFRMMEPVMIIIMSLIVGFIVISVALPMFSIYDFY